VEDDNRTAPEHTVKRIKISFYLLQNNGKNEEYKSTTAGI
jgi:hypothetical protein